MNFLGMGPWMMRKLAKQYNVASPGGAARDGHSRWASSSSRAR